MGGLLAVDVLGTRRGKDTPSGVAVVLAGGCRVRVPSHVAIERLVRLVQAPPPCRAR